MLWMAFIAFYEGNSPATAERLQGVNTNPASLGIKRGSQLILGFNPDDSTYWVSGGLAGLGISWDGNWKLHAAQPIFRNTLWIGTTWYTNNGALDYGLSYRPLRWVSVGAVAKDAFRENRSFDLGLGLRPMWDRLTLFGNISYSDSLGPWTAGVAVEPLAGVIFHGSYSENGSVGMGLDLSLGYTRISGQASYSDSVIPGNIEIEFSSGPYPQPALPTKRWVKVKLNGSYSEDGRQFLGSTPTFYGFISKMDSLANDPNVSGILFEMGNFHLSRAQAEEFRELIKKAKQNGKFVVFYADVLGSSAFLYVAEADRIVLAPQGSVSFPGLKVGTYYYKRGLDKIGVFADFERIKEYKTAAEPFTSDTMSEAQKEQLGELLDDFYGHMLDVISVARGMTPESLDALVDIGYFSAEKAVKAGLADTVAYQDELEDVLEGYAGGKIRKSEDYFGPEPLDRAWKNDRPKIALIVAEGGIVEGRGGTPPPLPIPFAAGKTMGKELAEAFARARKDNSVKAVVFRINSGGGSALGSDLIWREVKLTAEKKPVIVSMGDVAASGGYYIACPATAILATPMSVTGSIGIIGGKLVTAGLYEKLGITKPLLTTGHEHTLMWEETRKFTDEERAFFQQQLREGYDDFTGKVAQGRGISQDSVNAIGRGRVWSGWSAKGIGLVDELGGLLDAIQMAKDQAQLKNPQVVFYHPKTNNVWAKVLRTFMQASGVDIGDWWVLDDENHTYYLMPEEIQE